MAHWGVAMTHFYQLWDPPISSAAIPAAQQEIQLAQKLKPPTQREARFIEALALVYHDADTIPYRTRVLNYQHAMKNVAAENPKDPEAQVFYALALLANVSPLDKTHVNQKQAADLLEPLFHTFPQHPGIPHYLIHAYDNAELASRGLTAARDYSRIAPSASHAQHMPSHIFTRLGLWDDSIASNLAARDAARQHEGDPGEELHAMDYLVYAYLQTGRYAEAAQVIHELSSMPAHNSSDLKIVYASTAMPIRYTIERSNWADAAATVPPVSAPPHVVAVAIWARALGQARSGHSTEALAGAERLQQIESQLRTSGNTYWASQTAILRHEIVAWSAQAAAKPAEALAAMREAADQEDAVEKLPVTPGPIFPAREQLGYLLLEQNDAAQALKEFTVALANAPGRRGALQGAARAAQLSSAK